MYTDFIKVASEQQPEMMGKVATGLALLEKMSPEFAKEASAEISQIAAYADEKVASAFEVPAVPSLSKMDIAANTALGLGVAALGGAVMSASSDMYDAVKRGLTKGMNFKRIMKENPDLKERWKEEELRKNFSAIHRFGPEFTADPLVGGQILRAVMDVPQNRVPQILSLVDKRQALTATKKQQYSPTQLLAELPSVIGTRKAWEAMHEGKGRNAATNMGLVRELNRIQAEFRPGATKARDEDGK